ncbi:MAG: glycyl-radical enzyme activating protein [Lachnospiraceae bacterium]|nr:glycyl-radical enzyme activating protein [Lachnospiraceae bacterium]
MARHNESDMETLRGLVFGIQHFSIHDGRGIRSNVFLKGCPLHCLWCHNPEGLSPEPELQYFAERCVGCGRCGHVYRHMEQLAGVSAEKKESFVKGCVYGALELVGRFMTVGQILDDVEKDRIFFESSGGGLTLTGGEPMRQHAFSLALLKGAKRRGISTALETSGCAEKEEYRKILPWVDEFLWDFKETDSEKHRKFTGVGNEKILENLRFICAQGATVTLRCPIVPGLNDTEEHLRGIARLSLELKNLKAVELMPYHNMGVAKGRRLGTICQQEYRVPTEEEKHGWERRIAEIKKSEMREEE